MSTGTSLPCSRIHFKNDNPSPPGSTTSSSTKSGCSRGNASRAVSAESASAIRYFASSARLSPYRAAGSSSTISIVFMICFLTSLLPYLVSSMGNVTLNLVPRPTLTGLSQSIFPPRGGNPRTIIFHQDAQTSVFTQRAHLYLSPTRGGFHRIHHQVRHNVIKRLRTYGDLRLPPGNRHFQFQSAAFRLMGQDARHFFDHRGRITPPGSISSSHSRPAELQQLIQFV